MQTCDRDHTHKVAASSDKIEALFSFPVDLREHTSEEIREYQQYLQLKLSTIMNFEDFCEMTHNK